MHKLYHIASFRAYFPHDVTLYDCPDSQHTTSTTCNRGLDSKSSDSFSTSTSPTLFIRTPQSENLVIQSCFAQFSNCYFVRMGVGIINIRTSSTRDKVAVRNPSCWQLYPYRRLRDSTWINDDYLFILSIGMYCFAVTAGKTSLCPLQD